MKCLATRNTVIAIIVKFISALRNGPQPITIGPMLKVAVCQAPLGMNGVISGIIMLSTNDLTRTDAAVPITNATAKPTILYSFKNSLKSKNILLGMFFFKAP